MGVLSARYSTSSSLFPIDSEELATFVLEKRPTLKGKPFRIAF